MNTKRKILFTTLFILSFFTIITASIVVVSFRDYGISEAKEKSILTAELVRDALTAHMVNDIMDKRGYFLEKITNSQNIKNLWLIRSNSVENQFGASKLLDESIKDSIDIEVLESGKIVEVLKEDSKSANLRVTIPYIADSKGNPNCLECHKASEGEVLGAISMVFDISDVRKKGTQIIFKITLLAAILLIIVTFILLYFIRPYLDLYQNIILSIASIKDGNYNQKVKTKLKDEASEIAKWLNDLGDTLKNIVEEIDKKISTLLKYDNSTLDKNPLIKTKEIISELTDIYKFKKSVEIFGSKDDLYNSFGLLLKNRFAIYKFIIFESQLKSLLKELQYPKNIQKDEEFKFLVEFGSSIKRDIVKSYKNEDLDSIYYVCTNGVYIYEISYQVLDNIDIELLIYFKNEEEFSKFERSLNYIYNYFHSIKSNIESKLLLDMLKESSLRDALTGLYNRKFLDEYIDNVTSQALRAQTNYGILMVDIDYFKQINDKYGHDVGDDILKKIAMLLKESIRESDIAIRYGGEEFIILLYNVDPKKACEVADKINSRFKLQNFDANGEILKKSLSIGVSIFPIDSKSLWKCIKYADVALYRAKESGRDRVVRFIKDME